MTRSSQISVAEYEQKVIKLLCSSILSNSTIHKIIENPEEVSLQFTGTGYYLYLTHSEIPEKRIVCDSPNIVASYQEQEIGFVIVLEKSVLTLECYDYTSIGISSEIRRGTVEIMENLFNDK